MRQIFGTNPIRDSAKRFIFLNHPRVMDGWRERWSKNRDVHRRERKIDCFILEASAGEFTSLIGPDKTFSSFDRHERYENRVHPYSAGRRPRKNTLKSQVF